MRPAPPPIPLYPKPRRGTTWVTVIILALIVVVFVFGLSRWLQRQADNSGFTEDTSPRQVLIGSETLTIPANLMRFEEQRRALTLNEVDMVILWPLAEGYSTSRSAEFLATDGDHDLIFFSIGKRRMRHDMSARLPLIYRQLMTEPGRKGPAGLALQPLARGAGFDGEHLAIGQSASMVWVARCQNASTPTTPTCLRDVNIGRNLSLRYRFPLSMLAQWRDLEAKMNTLAQTMLDR